MSDIGTHGRTVEPMEWLESALEHLRACSVEALHRLEAGDLDRMAELLEEREALIGRIAPLLSAARPPELEWTLEAALAADARLAEALSTRLAGVVEELKRLDDRGRVAVGGGSTGRLIDLVR